MCSTVYWACGVLCCSVHVNWWPCLRELQPSIDGIVLYMPWRTLIGLHGSKNNLKGTDGQVWMDVCACCSQEAANLVTTVASLLEYKHGEEWLKWGYPLWDWTGITCWVCHHSCFRNQRTQILNSLFLLFWTTCAFESGIEAIHSLKVGPQKFGQMVALWDFISSFQSTSINMWTLSISNIHLTSLLPQSTHHAQLLKNNSMPY